MVCPVLFPVNSYWKYKMNWGALTYYGSIHPPPQVLEARVVCARSMSVCGCGLLLQNSTTKSSVQVPILGEQNVLDAFVDHLLKDTQAIEIVRSVVILNMDHHDVLHPRLIVNPL